MLMLNFTKMPFSSKNINKYIPSLMVIRNKPLHINACINNAYLHLSQEKKMKNISSTVIQASSKLFTSTNYLMKYPFIHKNNPYKVKWFSITRNRSLWLYSSLAFCSISFFYGLYYRNYTLTIIDLKLKGIIGRIIANNKTIISIISNSLYSKCILSSTQKAFNAFIKGRILSNNEIMNRLKLLIRDQILFYLKSENVTKDVQSLLTKYLIANQSNRQTLFDFIHNNLINSNSENVIKLIEAKFIELLSNEYFRQYVYNEVANETQSMLKDSNTINYFIQHINS